jgi:hypothetical protein
MANELRDPHDPVIPGEHVHPAEGHGGISMPIGVSGDKTDAHEPVVTAEPAQDTVARVEDNPPAPHTEDQPQAAEAEKAIADSDSKAEASQGDVSAES